MTYESGGLIQAVDYNGFVSTNGGANVNGVWGVGSGDTGWGQTNTLSTVSNSPADTVTATQWSNLCSRITSMLSQTNTTTSATPARSSPTAGDIISILAALNTDLTNCTTNRGNAPSLGSVSNSWTGATAKLTGSGSGAAAWIITWTQTVTFPSAAQARYFWNAGGLVKLDMSKTTNITNTDAIWNTFTSTVGTLVLSGRVNNATQTIAAVPYTGFTRIGGTGTPSPNLTTTGWYTLASGAAPTTIFQLTSDIYLYTDFFIRVTASVNADRTVLTLVTTWSDSGIGQTSNISGGTDTASPYTAFGTAPAVLCRFLPPSSTYLNDTWGTPVIASSVI